MGASIVAPLAVLMDTPMAATLAGSMVMPLTCPSNVGSAGKHNGETPSQHIVRLLLDLDNLFVSASTADVIDSSCVG